MTRAAAINNNHARPHRICCAWAMDRETTRRQLTSGQVLLPRKSYKAPATVPPSHHPCGNAVLVRGFVCFCGIKRGAIGKWICGRPRFSSISSFQVGNISCVLRLFGATFNQDTVIEVGVFLKIYQRRREGYFEI
jgi:hypothetical protein